MRILVAMPHFFGELAADTTNKSRQTTARAERVQALATAITSLHQTFGSAIYGLDHARRTAWQAAPDQPHAFDLVICTVGKAHLLGEIGTLQPLYRHHNVVANPVMLGFEAHKLMRDAKGNYDYYCYVEDDIVLNDPIFFKKRRLFDTRFGPHALLQPNRYELSAVGPAHKLYVDYQINAKVTEFYQDVTDAPILNMPFAEETIRFERTTYPSAGSFFLNADQLDIWTGSRHFLDGDISYLSALDSAATLSVMKTFRIYKPVLDNAWFLEVLHASPRWNTAAPPGIKFVDASERS